MTRLIRRTASLLFVTALTTTGSFAVATPRVKQMSANRAAVTPVTSVATHYVEVRIRRLHLVRPDLIQYPIAYEVFC